MKRKNTKDCLSWNCCDERLKMCIERSEDVNNTRRGLKERKLRNKFQ
ncbi:MAG: hypothetical protein ACFFE4_01705 [Candidatus Thorarchaeota archaeon]